MASHGTNPEGLQVNAGTPQWELQALRSHLMPHKPTKQPGTQQHPLPGIRGDSVRFWPRPAIRESGHQYFLPPGSTVRIERARKLGAIH